MLERVVRVGNAEVSRAFVEPRHLKADDLQKAVCAARLDLRADNLPDSLKLELEAWLDQACHVQQEHTRKLLKACNQQREADMTFQALKVAECSTGYDSPRNMGTGHLEHAIESAIRELEADRLSKLVKGKLEVWLEMAQRDFALRFQSPFMVSR